MGVHTTPPPADDTAGGAITWEVYPHGEAVGLTTTGYGLTVSARMGGTAYPCHTWVAEGPAGTTLAVGTAPAPHAARRAAAAAYVAARNG